MIPTLFRALLCVAVASSAVVSAADAKLPRVLLIGDSISKGYGGTASSLLEGKAVVLKNPGNGSSTGYGLSKPKLPKDWRDPEAVDDPENPDNKKKKRRRPRATNAAGVIPVPTDYDTYLAYYLAHGPFDIIHFNWGLHDLKKGGIPQDRYLANLTTLVEQMEATGATLIFATTTPVPKVNKERREPAKVAAFNTAAADMLSKRGVRINDLHAAMLPKQAEMQLPNNVHFTRPGYSFLGRHVAKAVEEALAARQ